jgi:glycosyltransferase involved in cell wall biosynthesis
MADAARPELPRAEPGRSISPEGVLGVLTQMGGGLRDFERSGQLDTLFRYHLVGYLQAFERISFFSYLDERIEDFTDDPDLRSRVRIYPKPARIPDKLYAAVMPWIYRRQVRECSVFRVLQATGAPPAILACAAYGIPYVTTFGYRYSEFARIERSPLKGAAVSALEWAAARWASAIIVTTEAMRAHVKAIAGSTPIVMIPNGVDTELFSPAEASRMIQPPPRLAPTVVFVGRLEAQKNLEVLVRAMATVRRRHPARLVVVGDGSLRETMLRDAAAVGVPVTSVGVVPNHQVPSYLRTADVFVLPSLAEGHPKALLEAMSCGVACVVSSCEGNLSLAENGVTALTHEPSDAEGLARAIERVLGDPALGATLGARARERVVARLGIDGTVRQTSALLRQVADRRRGRS